MKRDPHNWVRTVKTVTVNTPRGVMKRTAHGIVAVLLRANRKLPIGSLIRFVQFYLNRGGVGIPKKRREVIEDAKRRLQILNRNKRK